MGTPSDRHFAQNFAADLFIKNQKSSETFKKNLKIVYWQKLLRCFRPAGRPAARRWAASHMRLSRSPQKSLTKMRLSRSPQTDKSHKDETI